MIVCQNSKELVQQLLAKRAGQFSPLAKLFKPHLEQLKKETGLNGGTLAEVIWNALNDKVGPGTCEVCLSRTKLYPLRGGWAQYCSKSCMNSKHSTRHQKSEITKLSNGTGIGQPMARKKSVDTLIRRYGFENPSLIPEVVQKRFEKSMNDRGVSSPLKDPIVKAKISDTMVLKYQGTGRASPEISERISATTRANILQNICKRLGDEWVVKTLILAGLHEQKLDLVHKCGTFISKYMWTGQHLFVPRCPKCHGSSLPQMQVLNFISDLGFSCLVNDRKIIKPLELDIVVLGSGIAIEINGARFHGERYGKDSKYHLRKTEMVSAAGLQLIHLTDIDINSRWPAVSDMLRAKLGVAKKINARNCTVQKIDSVTANIFLERFHLQGACISSIRYGLFFKKELVAVLTAGRPRFTKHSDLELIRFASAGLVRGGASKLLKALSIDYAGNKLVSYADRRWSKGDMYQTLGFTLDGVTKPGFKYYIDGELHNRMKFRRHLLNDNSPKSEAQIMLDRGADRMWDCGSLRFTKIL